jgi:hypothetical protein
MRLHDAGVPHGGQRLRLGQEAPSVFLPGVGAVQGHLQGHEPAEALLAGQVDDPHATPPQLLQDLVTGHGGLARPRRRTSAAADQRRVGFLFLGGRRRRIQDVPDAFNLATAARRRSTSARKSGQSRHNSSR